MSAIPKRFDGYVLAGGESRRMGFPKPDIELHGRTLLERSIATLQGFCDEVTVVGNRFRNDTGLRVLEDLPVGGGIDCSGGPLAGLHTALSDSNREWIAVLACDLPLVDVKVFDRLNRAVALRIERGELIDAVVPIQHDGRYQPLAAMYRTQTCAAALETSLTGSDLSLRNFLSQIRAVYIRFAEDRADHNLFLNLNCPEDITTALLALESFDH